MTPEQEELLIRTEKLLNEFNRSDRYVIQKLLQILDGRNIQLGRGTGTKLGTAADQKLGFFGKTPVIQQPAITAPSGGTTVDGAARGAIGALITELHNLGLIA